MVSRTEKTLLLGVSLSFFSFLKHMFLMFHCLVFDVPQKRCGFPTILRTCFAFFFFFFYCSLFFVREKTFLCVKKSFFQTHGEIPFKILFSLHFSHKKPANIFSIFFCFTFFLASFFIFSLSSPFPFHFLLIPFCFSRLFLFSLSPARSFFTSLSQCFSFFSSISCFFFFSVFFIAVFAYLLSLFY